jgi:hypothetical protein
MTYMVPNTSKDTIVPAGTTRMRRILADESAPNGAAMIAGLICGIATGIFAQPHIGDLALAVAFAVGFATYSAVYIPLTASARRTGAIYGSAYGATRSFAEFAKVYSDELTRFGTEVTDRTRWDDRVNTIVDMNITYRAVLADIRQLAPSLHLPDSNVAADAVHRAAVLAVDGHTAEQLWMDACYTAQQPLDSSQLELATLRNKHDEHVAAYNDLRRELQQLIVTANKIRTHLVNSPINPDTICELERVRGRIAAEHDDLSNLAAAVEILDPVSVNAAAEQLLNGTATQHTS